MRQTFKIQAVENITNNYSFVPRMSDIPTDATHILEGNMVYKVTFTIGHIMSVDGTQANLKKVDRTYVAFVELNQTCGHYLLSLRSVMTPANFETTDLTKQKRWLSGREVVVLNRENKVSVKLSKALVKKTGLTIYPWA